MILGLIQMHNNFTCPSRNRLGLIGPKYSPGLTTGATVVVTGTDDLNYSIVKLEVLSKTVAIIASDQFTPKSNIAGFSTLYPGLNLSVANITGDGIGKFYGTAQKAENLVVRTQQSWQEIF